MLLKVFIHNPTLISINILPIGNWYYFESNDNNQADDPIAAQDAWIGLTGENFKIRGPNYLKDKKKILSKECVFKCLCCELVNSKTRMDNFSAPPVSLVQKLRSQGYKGLIYVYNIMV